MLEYILIASSLVSFTFGFSEKKCGDIGNPVICSAGATTASGEPFLPLTIASAALPIPKRMKMKSFTLKFKAKNGKCVDIRINDKAPEKWIGKRGFEFTPAALKALGHLPSKVWSGVVELCHPVEIKNL